MIKKKTPTPPWVALRYKRKVQERVKVSSKYLPMNKNLKIKRTSYITLKYISYKSVLKKIPSRYRRTI